MQVIPTLQRRNPWGGEEPPYPLYSLIPYTSLFITMVVDDLVVQRATQIARFMGPTWGPSGAARAQVGPMLAPWTLLSGKGFSSPGIDLVLPENSAFNQRRVNETCKFIYFYFILFHISAVYIITNDWKGASCYNFHWRKRRTWLIDYIDGQYHTSWNSGCTRSDSMACMILT